MIRKGTEEISNVHGNTNSLLVDSGQQRTRLTSTRILERTQTEFILNRNRGGNSLQSKRSKITIQSSRLVHRWRAARQPSLQTTVAVRASSLSCHRSEICSGVKGGGTRSRPRGFVAVKGRQAALFRCGAVGGCAAKRRAGGSVWSNWGFGWLMWEEEGRVAADSLGEGGAVTIKGEGAAVTMVEERLCFLFIGKQTLGHHMMVMGFWVARFLDDGPFVTAWVHERIYVQRGERVVGRVSLGKDKVSSSLV